MCLLPAQLEQCFRLTTTGEKRQTYAAGDAYPGVMMISGAAYVLTGQLCVCLSKNMLSYCLSFNFHMDSQSILLCCSVLCVSPPPPFRRCVVAVYQAHVGSINSLCVGDGLAATASDDATLRIWPLDFRWVVGYTCSDSDWRT